jgi:Flp pilus assembly protein TadG
MVHHLRLLWRDARGSAVIETAFVCPLLAIMALGAFDVSRMVARQTELQDIAAEVSQMSMAKVPESIEDLEQLQSIAMAASGLSEDDVTIELAYRCNNDTTLQAASSSCESGDEVSTLITIEMEDSYIPQWTEFGIGSAVDLEISRTSQIG